MPSRRQTRHFGPRSLATRPASASSGGRRSAPKKASQFPAGRNVNRGGSHSPPLLLADAVVGLRGDILDAEDLEAGRLERADRRLTSRAGPFDEDLDLLQTVLHALAGGVVGGHLRREGRRLARALEAGGAGGLPRD